ncbi:TPA: aminotransferase class V-fold PLP-dependent enzyme [Bacillus cereus]|nr:aminotransferase class V-fold PLP-dependent enzyme [Bacillus cereus]
MVHTGRFHLEEHEMKRMGYETVDMIVEHLCTLQDKRVIQPKESEWNDALLHENIPMEGKSWETVFKQLQHSVLANSAYPNHPRYFAYVPSPGNYISALAEFITNSFNIFAGSWILSPGAAQVEMATMNWIKDMFRFPQGSGGLFVSGGSMANLTALVVAKHAVLQNDMQEAVIYCSEQTHSSIQKAVTIAGFQPEQVCIIPCNHRFEISISALHTQIQQDCENGKKPFCIIANLGTTNTGTVDPIEDLVSLASQYGIWIHGDAAFGGPAILAKPEAFTGIEKLDSLSFDPHKWFFQSYDIGCILVKDASLLKNCFFALPEYLQDAETTNQEINFSDYGMELTRRFRALKLWLSLKIYGLRTFQQAIQKGLHLTEETQKIVQNSKYLERITSGLGVCVFRFVPSTYESQEAVNELNENIVKDLHATGFAMVSTTILTGKKVIRLCPLHPDTTIHDIRETLQRIEYYGDKRITDKKSMVVS